MPHDLAYRLSLREKSGTLRRLVTVPELIDLTSNDYLGFARSLQLCHSIEEINRGLIGKTSLSGATGSRLLSGNSAYVVWLEEYIAKSFGAEASLIFNSGYLANLGLISAIANEESTVIYDSEIHASIKDGIRLSKARSFPFRHQDLMHLESRLRNAPGGSFVCVESVYSMSGDVSPIIELSQLCERYGHRLIVDEAHALGVIGEQGEGLVKSYGLESKIFARLITFGKALGAHGAAILGSKLLCDYLINFSRPFIYTTAMPNHSLAAIFCGVQALACAYEERSKLSALVKYFYAHPFHFGGAQPILTPICPIIISGVDRARLASEELAKSGIDVRAIVSPTVKRGKEQLRVALHAFNSKSEIDLLFDVLRKCVS